MSFKNKKKMQSITSISSRRAMFNFLHQKCNGLTWSNFYIEIIEKEIHKFSLSSYRKWTKVNRNIQKFIKINTNWLNAQFKMPINKKQNTSTTLRGRPRIDFISSAERSQRRKIKAAITYSSMNSPEMLYAVKNIIFMSGQRTAAKLLKDSLSYPQRAKQINMAFKDLNKSPIPYTAVEALAFIIDNKLTKQQYINIRLGSKNRNCDIYPSYENIVVEKKKCYPCNIDNQESSCKIPLQSLLDHTTDRILQIPEVCKINSNVDNFKMLYKWGCDGSSGHSQYKQKFNDDTSSTITDQSMLMFSIVPLELRTNSKTSIENNYDVIWKNPSPSSTKFFRPIKYMYKKETVDSTLKEVKDIETQIENLINTNTTYNDKIVHVEYTLLFTMVDGKVNCVSFIILNN